LPRENGMVRKRVVNRAMSPAASNPAESALEVKSRTPCEELDDEFDLAASDFFVSAFLGGGEDAAAAGATLSASLALAAGRLFAGAFDAFLGAGPSER